ncbi:unnamed protein product [Musa acuminata var. zebrina]
MYHHYHQSHSNIFSSRETFPADGQLLLQRGGSAPEESGLVLSTDAKPRLKWTSELHERFIEAVNQLGGADKATPKTVMRLMGIPGLTLYHLKSHLQKYRLSKNLQAQANSGSTKSVIGCTLAAERTIDVNGSFMVNTSTMPQSNKSFQINEALQMQIEVQRQLQEHLEVQRNLQLQIEAQGKYLQSVLEKAQETLGKQNLGSPGVEDAKVQLCELVSKISNECFSNAFQGSEEIPGLNTSELHPSQPVDCSVESCLTSFEGSPSVCKSLRSCNGSLPLCQQQVHENSRLENTQSAWCYLHEHKTFSSSSLGDSERTSFAAQKDFETLPTSIKTQNEGGTGSEARGKESDDENISVEHLNSGRPADQQGRGKQSDRFGLLTHTAQLDLNAHEDNEGGTSSRFDLNGFSWS